jgi:hypothetical protein
MLSIFVYFHYSRFRLLNISLDFQSIICSRSQITIFCETVSYHETSRTTFSTIYIRFVEQLSWGSTMILLSFSVLCPMLPSLFFNVYLITTEIREDTHF